MQFPSEPLSYTVEITYACNHFCSGCANVSGSQRDLVLTDWKRLFDTIAPVEDRRKYAQLIRITGGEPTLHPDFFRIIEYVDSLDIPYAIFTNGLWNNPEQLITLFRKCTHLVGLLVSLHGSTAEAHTAFVENDGSSFQRTCANIRKATESGLEIFTNTVLTKHSCEQIEEIIALSQQLGSAHAVFDRYLGRPLPFEPSESQLRQAINRIEILHNEGVSCHLGDCVPPCFVPNSSLGANGGIEHCIISPEGNVRPDNLTSYTFGNLFEQTIEEIWQSEKADWYRKQLPESCLECVELSRCRGGCRSITIEYGLQGDPLMKQPLLEIAQDTLEFHPDWKVFPNFTIREEPFGYLLCRYNWSVPVTSDAKPLLDAIMNREATLAELHERFGDAGLELIGHLYKEGCLEFE